MDRDQRSHVSAVTTDPPMETIGPSNACRASIPACRSLAVHRGGSPSGADAMSRVGVGHAGHRSCQVGHSSWPFIEETDPKA